MQSSLARLNIIVELYACPRGCTAQSLRRFARAARWIDRIVDAYSIGLRAGGHRVVPHTRRRAANAVSLHWYLLVAGKQIDGDIESCEDGRGPVRPCSSVRPQTYVFFMYSHIMIIDDFL